MTTMQAKYNRLAENYHENRDMFDLRALFDAFYGTLGSLKKGTVLDLGCGVGDGFPAYFIEKGWQVEGIDFSINMLALAEKYHPKMKASCEKLEQIELLPEHYEVIESIYALFHLSNEEQFACIQECYRALKKGGYLFFTYADKEYTGSEVFEGTISFMGESLFYAHDTPQRLQNFMIQVGFKNVQMLKHTIGGETFLWVCAQK